MKARHIVGVERGFGPRHAFNAQEGTEAVPSELPTPPYQDENYGGKALRWVADQVRQGVLPDEALAEMRRDPTSLRSILGYGQAALAVGTLLSSGGGERLPIGGESVKGPRIIDVTEEPHLPAQGPRVAVKLDDGTIIHSKDAGIHAVLAHRAGIDPERIIDAGFYSPITGEFRGGKTTTAPIGQ